MTVLKTIGLIVLLIIVLLMWNEGGLRIWSHTIIGFIAYAIYFGSIVLNLPTWYKIGICIVTIIGTWLYLAQLKNLIIHKIEDVVYGKICNSYGKKIGSAVSTLYFAGKIFIPNTIDKAVGYGTDYVIDNYIGRIKYTIICILVFGLYIFLLSLPFIIR